MESFFRYVSYVDYYKNGDKIKNVGFLRWKLHNDMHQVEIQLKDVNASKGNFEIREKNTGKAIGEILMDKGIGNFTKKFPSMSASGEKYIDTSDDRLYLSDVEGFLIRLNSNEYLSVPVNLEQEKKTDKFALISEKEKLSIVPEKSDEDNLTEILEKERKKRDSEISEKGGKKRDSEILEKGGKERDSEISEKGGKKRDSEILEKGGKERDSEILEKGGKERDFEISEKGGKKRDSEILEREEKNRRVEINKKEEEEDIEAASENVLIEGIKEKYVDSAAKNKIKIIEPLHEDKWKQLCKEYPQVHPFPDKKVFLSIKPEDFIILQQGYQKLVHNSFLLHGFYNYGHMILGKLSDDEKAPIYVGVPGVYYEREKQAAQMFGFVGFESTEHPVEAGSYGYYMIEVEI